MAGPAVNLADGEVAVAADVGGTSMRMAIVGAGYQPGSTLPELHRFPSDELHEDPIGKLAMRFAGMVPPGERLAAAIVGLPTMFDAQTRIVRSSPNIRQLEGLDVGAALTQRLDVPVLADRETVLMATGEWLAGAARGHRAVLGVFIGTGVGGAMLFDGVPYRGASGAAVEIGHLPVGFDGAPCVCGNSDCLEAYASGHVLKDAAHAAGLPIERVFLDERLEPAVARYVQAIGYALAVVANTLDPDCLIIGGGLVSRGSFPMDRIIACAKDHLRAPNLRENLVIKPAMLGSKAIVPGAHHLLHRL